MSRVWSSDGPNPFLSKECTDAERQVVASVIAGDARGVARFLVVMVALAGGGRLPVTRRAAEQRGVLPNR